jgi:hypothetical protein
MTSTHAETVADMLFPEHFAGRCRAEMRELSREGRPWTDHPGLDMPDSRIDEATKSCGLPDSYLSKPFRGAVRREVALLLRRRYNSRAFGA